MYFMLIPGLSILALVAYQWRKMLRFQNSAQRVVAHVSWLPGGEEFQHHFKKKNPDGMAMLRDKEFMRRHKYALWVNVPLPDREPVECGVTSGRRLNLKHGDPIEVLYSPLQPETVVLPGENLWVGLVLVGLMGAFATGVPLFMLLQGQLRF